MSSRYVPLLRLAVGPVADIYLGVLQGAEGFRRAVVLKRAMPDMDGSNTPRSALVEEARVGAALSHPNIVQAYELCEIPEGLVLVMEYVSGVSLHALMSRVEHNDGVVPWPVAAKIIADAARGLDHAHRALGEEGAPLAIVHRDVAPRNILITGDGVTKVADFGIATTRFTAHKATGMFHGTPGYAAPEQVRGEPADWRADVFALGVLFWELLAGGPLFTRQTVEDSMKAVLSDPIPPLPHHVPRVLHDIVRSMLARDARMRQVSMIHVAQELDVIAAGQGGAAQDVVMMIRGEFGAQLERRDRRVRKLLSGQGSHSAAAPSSGDRTGTMAFLGEALDGMAPLTEEAATEVDRRLLKS